MIVELDQENEEDICEEIQRSFHHSFFSVKEKLKKWKGRFPNSVGQSLFHDLFSLYLFSPTQFLHHRSYLHLFRLVLSLHLMQKKLLNFSTFSPDSRHLQIRWIPTQLSFPFASRPVFGCLIGFNIMDRYEVFDEENIFLAFQKHLPQLNLVKEGSYSHSSQYKKLKIFYFEIEKQNGAIFSLAEQNLLKCNLEEKVKNSIQTLSPSVFMRLNEEEVYKNILVLSQEIQSLQDIPQAYIAFDRQTKKEIVFRINLVHMTPFHRFSLKERFFDCTFESHKTLTVRHLEGQPIEGHIFSLYLSRDPSILRSDGSLDFYSAREKVVTLLKGAIGEFRDYNGGILIKQQELLHDFKEKFPDSHHQDLELMKAFFYELTPLEKQILLSPETLATLFNYFQESRKEILSTGSTYSFKVCHHEQQVYLTVRGGESSLTQPILDALQEYAMKIKDMAYNFINTAEGVFFNCVLTQTSNPETELFIQSLRELLHHWHQKKKALQNLRVGLEYSIVSFGSSYWGRDNFHRSFKTPF